MIEEIIKIAKECGGIIKESDASHVEAKNHDRHNLVTEYDVKIENILRQRLLALLPQASFLGEEGLKDFERNGYCFICDPIDGTSNFIKGLKHSCISIALLQDGTPVLGVIYNPYLDEVFWAEKGKGAFCNGAPMSTTTDEPQDSLIVFGTAPYSRELSAKTWAFAAKTFASSLDLRRSGAAALDLAGVAKGRFGMYWEFEVQPWDYAAGSLIVAEAGGIVTTIEGQEIKNYFAKTTIAAMANDKFYQILHPLADIAR